MGLREQVNAHALRWIEEGKTVVLAAASKAMFDLYEKTQLRNLNVAAFCDINPEGKVPPVNIPVLPYSEIERIKPDAILIFSPAYSTEIYFQQKHWREENIEIVVLGEFL
ncbi:hypothetical protein ACSZM7_01955 [Aeromonas veronii]